MTAHEARTIRDTNSRIAATPAEELVTIIPNIAKSLIDCKTLLSAAPASGKDAANSHLVQRLKTQITTLLNSKTAQGRWAGTVLTKAVIEVGGLETLSKSGIWVRPLLSNLVKNDPPSSKLLAIITLTRIFDLTHGHQSIVREMTTPSLPAFITACLQLVDSKTTTDFTAHQSLVRHELLETTILSLAQLLPSHPTIFRTFLTQLNHLLLPLIVKTSLSSTVNQQVVLAAQYLFTLLHFSSPKSNKTSTTEYYSEKFGNLLCTLHTTVSLIFRSIIEEWRPIPGSDIKLVSNMDLDLTSGGSDALGLAPWTGIHDGCERVRGLLSLIGTFAVSKTSQDVSFPLGSVVDLLIRVCSVLVPPQPTTSKAFRFDESIRVNDQIPQTERDALFIELPGLHAAAMDVITSLCERFGPSCMSVHDIFLEQITWVFEREKFSTSLRVSCYQATTVILETSGAGLRKDTVRQCTSILDTCCDDIISCHLSLNAVTVNKNELTADTLSTSFKGASNALPAQVSTTQPVSTPLLSAASALLCTALSRLPSSYIPNSLRANMDRTAILARDTRAMLASVLNQPITVPVGKPRSSILPFLARAAPRAIETEGLIRPRLPVVVQSETYDHAADESVTENEIDVNEVEEMAGEVEEDPIEKMVKDDNPTNIGQPKETPSTAITTPNQRKRGAPTLEPVFEINPGASNESAELGCQITVKKPRLAGAVQNAEKSDTSAGSKSVVVTATNIPRPKADIMSPQQDIKMGTVGVVEEEDEDFDIPELIMGDSDDDEDEVEEEVEEEVNGLSRA